MAYIDERSPWSGRAIWAVFLLPVLIAASIIQIWTGMWIAKSSHHLWGIAPGLLAWVAPVTTLFFDVHDKKEGIERVVTAEVVGFFVGVPALTAIIVIGIITGII